MLVSSDDDANTTTDHEKIKKNQIYAIWFFSLNLFKLRFLRFFNCVPDTRCQTAPDDDYTDDHDHDC